jgi:hypothetical protein
MRQNEHNNRPIQTVQFRNNLSDFYQPYPNNLPVFQQNLNNILVQTNADSRLPTYEEAILNKSTKDFLNNKL